MMPLRWRARRPSNTAARRRVHPLRSAGERAALDTAVLASTRLALLARGGGRVPATRFWGAAARGDWEPRLEARLRTRRAHATVARPAPARPNPPALLQARADRFITTPRSSGPPPRRLAQRAHSNALPPFLFPHAARTQARAAARARRARARTLQTIQLRVVLVLFPGCAPPHARTRLGACARAAACARDGSAPRAASFGSSAAATGGTREARGAKSRGALRKE